MYVCKYIEEYEYKTFLENGFFIFSVTSNFLSFLLMQDHSNDPQLI